MYQQEDQFYSEFNNITDSNKFVLLEELGSVHLGVYSKEGTIPSNPIYNINEYKKRLKNNTYLINRTGEHIGVQMGAYKNQIPLDFQIGTPGYLQDLSFLDPNDYIRLFDCKCGEHIDKGYFDHVDMEYLPGLTSRTRRIFRIWFYVLYKRLIAFGSYLLPKQLISPVTVFEYNMVIKELYENEKEMERIKNETLHYVIPLRKYYDEMKWETEFGKELLSGVVFKVYNDINRLKNKKSHKDYYDLNNTRRNITNEYTTPDGTNVKAIFI